MSFVNIFPVMRCACRRLMRLYVEPVSSSACSVTLMCSCVLNVRSNMGIGHSDICSGLVSSVIISSSCMLVPSLSLTQFSCVCWS